MNSYKKLVSNSFIFAIGNLGSKAIAFLLVPLYTYYLSTSEYGTVDLTITTINMLLPIISLSIFEGILRFVMDKKNDTKEVISNSVLIAFMGYLVFLLTYPILNWFNVLGDNLVYLYVILFIKMFEQIFAQYARAIGKVKIFASNGILLTFTLAVFNILFLVVLELGVPGYFFAMMISYFISTIYLALTTGLYRNFTWPMYDKELTKNLLTFSIPMVPNSLMWWMINASSRYFIGFFVGISANGLFAVASRIPSLINILNQVFTQAWQISAIEEYNKESKPEFYNNVFSYLSAILLIGSSLLLVGLKVIFDVLFSADFYSSWQVVPFLLLGTIFSSFSSFLGTNYVVAKQTKGVFKTSFYGGVISLICNGVLIPLFGIIGAGLSSMLSFFAIFIIRYYDTKDYVNLSINWFSLLSSIGIILIQTAVLFMGLPMITEMVILFSLFIGAIVINWKLVTLIQMMIKSLLKKRSKKS